MRKPSFTFLLPLCVLLVSFWIGLLYYRRDKEVANYVDSAPLVWRQLPSNELSTATSSFDAQKNRYVWGRTVRPMFTIDLHPINVVQRYTQLKEFVWVGLSSEEWNVGIGVLQLQYASAMSLHVFRRGADGVGESWSHRRIYPLVPDGAGLGGRWLPNTAGKMGPRAAGHTVLFSALQMSGSAAPPEGINITFTETEILFHARSTVTSTDGNSSFVVEVDGEAGLPRGMMGLVFPLGPRRPAVVNKAAAAKLSKPLRLRFARPDGPHEVVLPNATLAMDYTRGLLRRLTVWYWACVTSASGVGLHLSTGTYDASGISVESSVFDGRTGKVSFYNHPVNFTRTVAADSDQVRWQITGEGLSLTFTPFDGYDGDVNVGFVHVNLDHRWGVYRGSLLWEGEQISFHDTLGVMEDHFALW